MYFSPRKMKLEKLDIGEKTQTREKGCGDMQDTESQKSFSGLETLSKQWINKNRRGTDTRKWVSPDAL